MRCKHSISSNWGPHRCKRQAVQDGYCRQHTPEEMERRALEQRGRDLEAHRRDRMLTRGCEHATRRCPDCGRYSGENSHVTADDRIVCERCLTERYDRDGYRKGNP